jgi:protein-disulfide isomerase
MSRDNATRSNLFGVVFFPALIVGVLIIVALLIVSYGGGSRAVANGSDSHVHQLSNGMIQKFKNKFDARGMSMGSPNAPVSIREFGDYQCPACGAFEPTAKRIRNQFVKTGRARFIFFDFPLPMHANAHEAAIAARCGARQHKFWAYHERLYKNQDQWAGEQDPTSTFLDLAVESGLKTQPLQHCIAQDATAKIIAKEKAAGKAVKLQATPTLIVGKTLFTGAPSYQRVKQIVDRLAPAKKTDGKNTAE